MTSLFTKIHEAVNIFFEDGSSDIHTDSDSDNNQYVSIDSPSHNATEQCDGVKINNRDRDVDNKCKKVKSDISPTNESGMNLPFDIDIRTLFPDSHLPSSYGEYFDACVNQHLAKCDDSLEILSVKKAFCEWERQWLYADNAVSSLEDLGFQGMEEYEYCEGDNDIELKRGFTPVLEAIVKDFPRESIVLSKPVKTIHWGGKSNKESNNNILLGGDNDRELKCETESRVPVEGNKTESNNDIPLGGKIIKRSLGPNTHSPEFEGETKIDDSRVLSSGNSSHERRCSVDCEDGDKYRADYVIVTVSLGVLKERATTLFSPALPARRLLAFKNMAFGSVDKIFLQWDEADVFWSGDSTGFAFLWLEDSPVVVKSDKCKRKTKTGHAWYHGLMGLETVSNQPGFLLAFLSGEQADIMETVDETEVKDVCVDILALFTGLDIPTPKRMSRSMWRSNPYIRGSYSVLRPDTSLEDHHILQESLPSPQNPELLFAGEACSRHQISTTNDARDTGLTAAEVILKNIQK